MRITEAEQDIKVWHEIIAHYNRKPYNKLGIKHLLGYLKRCSELGELQPDRYTSQWRYCIRYILRHRPNPEHELALVSLYYTLAHYADTHNVEP
jgi:hypothetical protein